MNFNLVCFGGRLTRDPQLSYTPNQTACVEFGMASNRKWVPKDGQAREEVTYIDCRMFGKRAEVVNQYCSKGDPLFVSGRLTFDSWTADDGTKRSKLRVTVENFEFISAGEPRQASPKTANPDYVGDNPAPPEDDDIPF